MSQNDSNAPDLSSWAPGWWKDQGVAVTLSHCFARHVVALGISLTCEGKRDYQWLTGFLVQVGDLDFWLTAGHIIDAIEEILHDPRVKVVRATWNDGYDNSEAVAVPVSMEDLPRYRDAENDFGAILIRKGYAAPILANPKIVPLTPEIWWHHKTSRPDGFYVVGHPREWCELQEVARSRKGRFYFAASALACIPVDRISPDPGDVQNEFWAHPDAFYGQVLPVMKSKLEPLRSIKGTSGGPIFSIERTPDNHLKYRLFGIQLGYHKAEF